MELRRLDQRGIPSCDLDDAQGVEGFCRDFAGYVALVDVNSMDCFRMSSVEQWLAMLRKTKSPVLFWSDAKQGLALPRRRQLLEYGIYAWQPLLDQDASDDYRLHNGVLVCHRSVLPKMFMSLIELNNGCSGRACIRWSHLFTDQRSVVLIAHSRNR